LSFKNLKPINIFNFEAINIVSMILSYRNYWKATFVELRNKYRA
jgi:hypothetical protein